MFVFIAANKLIYDVIKNSLIICILSKKIEPGFMLIDHKLKMFIAAILRVFVVKDQEILLRIRSDVFL